MASAYQKQILSIYLRPFLRQNQWAWVDTFDPVVFHALGIQQKAFEKEIAFLYLKATISS